jgi:FAD/FMN-containing dehydrogenase
VVATSGAQAQALWALRENVSEAQRIEGVSIKHDVSVPVSRIAEFLERASEALAAALAGCARGGFGHIGDGNLHYNLSKPDADDNAAFVARTAEVNRIVHDLVCELGGSISAEHGLGQLKRDEVLRYKPALEMELMRADEAGARSARFDESGQGAVESSFRSGVYRPWGATYNARSLVPGV